MSQFNFDDTETSGIWWSTNVSIRDLCVELKADTSCGDSEIVELLRSIAKSIEVNGLETFIYLIIYPLLFIPLKFPLRRFPLPCP